MGTTTLTNLQGLLAGVAGVVGVAIMAGIAIAVFRYYASPDSTDRKLPLLQKNVARIVAVGVSCAILASASWYTSAFEFFADTGGMDEIKASASASSTATRPLSPDTASGWAIEAIPTLVIGTDGSGGYVAGQDTTQASLDFRDKVDAMCREENRNVDWPQVYAMLKAEGSPSNEGELGWLVKNRLMAYGIKDFSDLVLYNSALVDEGARLQATYDAESWQY